VKRHRGSIAAGIAGSALVAVLAAAWFSAPPVGPLHADVPLSRIAPAMRNAIVATEDERFFHNHGIDLLGIARAIPYDVSHFSFAQGASTITDQLVKRLYLHGNDHSPWRKLEDLALSLQISTKYPKDEVLAAYLDTAYFGDGAYGVSAAARHYFGVPASRLSLAQASLLAGLVQAPSAYDPVTHPLAARWRQVDVLRSLVRDGYATPKEANGVLARPLPLRGGRALPALRGVSVASLPAFALGRLALGLCLFLGAAAVFFVLRRKVGGQRLALVALRAACLVALLAGVLTISSSFNGL
jgi:membrane peptidoglycan carboxypeptidase